MDPTHPQIFKPQWLGWIVVWLPIASPVWFPCIAVVVMVATVSSVHFFCCFFDIMQPCYFMFSIHTCWCYSNRLLELLEHDHIWFSLHIWVDQWKYCHPAIPSHYFPCKRFLSNFAKPSCHEIHYLIFVKSLLCHLKLPCRTGVLANLHCKLSFQIFDFLAYFWVIRVALWSVGPGIMWLWS